VQERGGGGCSNVLLHYHPVDSSSVRWGHSQNDIDEWLAKQVGRARSVLLQTSATFKTLVSTRRVKRHHMTWRACRTRPCTQEPGHPLRVGHGQGPGQGPSPSSSYRNPLLAQLNNAFRTFRTRSDERGRPQMPAEAWLRVTECPDESLGGGGATRGGAVHGVPSEAQLQTFCP